MFCGGLLYEERDRAGARLATGMWLGSGQASIKAGARALATTKGANAYMWMTL